MSRLAIVMSTVALGVLAAGCGEDAQPEAPRREAGIERPDRAWVSAGAAEVAAEVGTHCVTPRRGRSAGYCLDVFEPLPPELEVSPDAPVRVRLGSRASKLEARVGWDPHPKTAYRYATESAPLATEATGDDGRQWQIRLPESRRAGGTLLLSATLADWGGEAVPFFVDLRTARTAR